MASAAATRSLTVSGRYLDSRNLDSDITWRYLDSQNLDNQNLVRVRVRLRVSVRVGFRVRFRVNCWTRVSYD